MTRVPLPIDAELPRIQAALAARGAVVLIAEPGAGKTTRVPPALLDARTRHEVIVLEPRRLAARLSAERVASELGEKAGQTVGYITRFERAVSEKSALMFLTEGVLEKRLLSDPRLDGVKTVVLDEFHERHLASDLSLALLRRLRRGARPDLRLVVMSATLEPGPLAAYLDADVISATGRTFPVELRHSQGPDDRPLESRVASGVFDFLALGLPGDVLVFLPGAREIRRAQESLRRLAEKHDLAILPLHGSLPREEQDRAIGPNPRRKVILSTNVAETSVTIDGVTCVIDSGLSNQASHSPWTGLPTLKQAKIARSSATQRAGRAGRTRAGVCLRLFGEGDLQARPAFDAPEIARADLAGPVLELGAHGVDDVRAFGWFESPPSASVDKAIELLAALDAVRVETGRLEVTELGRRMLELPVHPRQARVVLEGQRRGVGRDACGLAAILEDPPKSSARDHASRSAERSDAIALLDELDAGPARHGTAARVRDQLLRALRERGGPAPDGPKAYEDALLLSLLAGYPDRVGRLKRESAQRRAAEIVFAGGGSAMLDPESRVRETDLLIALSAEDRVVDGRSRPVVRLASAIEADWLLDLFFAQVRDEEELTLAPGTGRVEVVRRMRFGQLVLEETRARVTDRDKITAALAQAALARGQSLEQKEGLERIELRLALAMGAKRSPLAAPPIDPRDLPAVLREAAARVDTLEQLGQADLAAVVLDAMPSDLRRRLDKLAPERVELPSGRTAQIEYRRDQTPSVASRLQDFFGCADGPRILDGELPLLLSLTAPNQRAVQVTTDLAGFWDRHYPAIAKELRRKYPRHSWPDDPRTAAPEARPKRRN